MAGDCREQGYVLYFALNKGKTGLILKSQDLYSSRDKSTAGFKATKRS
jgi:hypothetical protein